MSSGDDSGGGEVEDRLKEEVEAQETGGGERQKHESVYESKSHFQRRRMRF